MRIITQHGSPGAPDDLNSIKQEGSDHEWLNLTRLEFQNTEIRSEDILIGYSFGASLILKKVATSDFKPKCIILIAPYVLAKPVGTLKKVILNLPILGNKILKSKADSAIEQMLIDSSLPAQVTNTYKKVAQKYKEVSLLKESILEKNITTSSMERYLTSTDQEIHIIQGNQDQTSKMDHIEFIQKFSKKVSLKIIKDAGHAIPWTHTEEVKKELTNIIGEI